MKSSGPRTTSLSKYIETGFWEHGFAFWKKKKKPARWSTTSPLMSSSTTTTWPYFAKKILTDPFLQIIDQSDPFLQKSPFDNNVMHWINNKKPQPKLKMKRETKVTIKNNVILAKRKKIILLLSHFNKKTLYSRLK